MNTSTNIRKWLVVSIFAAVATAFSSKAQPTCTPAPSGLVSWWQAEGNGLDSAGGNTAYAPVLPGGVTFGPGEVGQGFQLNGTNAYLMVPASPSLNIGTGSGITMEGWIKVSSVDGLHPIAEWYSDVRDVLGVQFWINSSPFESGGLLAVLIDTNSNRQALTSPQGILQPNAFQHVAMTYDQASGITKIYLNGAAVAQANMGSFVPQTSYNLWIAHRPFDRPGDWTYGATLGGILDEFSLYNRALSADDIASIYNAGAAGKCDGNSSGIAPALTSQPTNQTVTAGANATFTVTAAGSQPLHYEWYGPDNFEIPGADTSTLTLSNVQPSDAGSYYAFVTNQFGFAQSSNAVLTVTGATTNSNPGTPPLDGLVAWWKGENNTLDSAGTNNGVVTRGLISYAPGEVGAAFQYDDSSGYVAVPAAPSLNVGQGAGFTLEAWIQPGDLQNQMPVFEWEYDTNTAADGVHFWVSSIGGAGCLFANIVDSSFNSHWIYSAPGLITADYQHVALTYDKSSGVASIYRNGVLVATQNLGSFTPDTTGNLLLGERTYLNNEPQYHYVGGLDEMSVYSRALSQSEIAAIYNAGSAGKGGSTNSNGSGPGATQLVLPNYSATNQVYNPAGSLNQPLRMQMVYGASQFPAHPIVITEIRWRPDANVGGPLSIIVSNLQIKLSTTVATPDNLSTVFTQNTGTNETVAYSGAASVSTAFTTLSNGTKAFDLSLPLQTPFAYDPTKGNLLVDLRNLYGCIPARPVEQNIVNSTGENDAVSRVFSIDPDATDAETADTGADVLEIIYTAATNTTNTATSPFITQQPTNQTVAPGGNAFFSAAATGSAPLHYQWYGPSETLIAGATTSTLVLSNVQPADAGAYFVLVTNQVGFAVSSNAVLAVSGGSGGGGTNFSTPLPGGIAAWWRAESNTLDSINGNNGTISGGVTYVDHVVGHAFLFDGTSGYISVPASPSLNIGAGSGLTIECWVKPNHLGPIGEEGRPIVEYDTASSIGVHFYFESGNRLYANLRDTAENDHAIISPSGSLSSNVLSHVAVTYDRTNGTSFLYINGVQVASNYFGNFTPQTTYPLSIGIRAASGFPGSGVVYNGVLDELSLYSRALNSSEIQTIFQAGMNGKSAPTDSGTIPTITNQPTNQTVTAGANVTFTATASGTAPLHYEWYGPDNFEIPGANSSTLTLSNVQPSNAGSYYAFVTNSFGFAQSSNAVLTITNPPAPLCVTAATNIAAWWPAEGTGADIVGGATATLHGGATFAPGEVGRAFFLNGTNDYLTATSSNLNIAAGGSFTVEAWIKVSDVADYHPIVEWNDNAGHAGVHFWILPYSGETPGVLFANLVDTGGSSHAFHAPGGSVSTNGFQHVALTYDQSSGIATIYANSNIVAQLPLGSFTPQTSYELWMGHRPNDAPEDATYGAHLGGLLDELSLYNRALSQSEIGAIYNAGANGKCPPSQVEQHTAINSQPVVNLAVSGKSPVLSWPASANGFILQSADDLAPPVNWTNVPGIPATNGGNIEMTLPTSGQRGYFRLYHP